MESLLKALIDRGYAYDVATKMLGIDKQQGNPKYTFGMPFTGGKLQINPMRMIANQGIKSIMGGGGSGILSTLGPLALGAGAIYLLNKNREKLTGYKTQQAYEDARNQRRADSRLDKITDRIVAGKNYGNYERALLDSGAGAINVNDKIMYSSDYFAEPGYKKLEAPKPKTYTPPVYQGGGGRDSGSTASPSGGGNFASQNTGTNENFSNTTGKGRTGYVRGGIASL